MKQGISTITTPFTSEVDGVNYEYKTTHLSGQTPSVIHFTVMRDNATLAIGNKRPQENKFYFETQSPVLDQERAVITNQINVDLLEVEELAKNI